MTEIGTSLEADEAGGSAYGRVAELLRGVSGIRLEHYKRGAVLRRMMRRMRRLGYANIEEYTQRLEQDRDEAGALARDMLVPGTAFFRDPEIYAGLSRLLPQLLADSHRPQIWVPACAGGEEVFSIAMLVAEALAAREAPEEFLVFGTDVDAGVLAEARAARFTAAAAERVPTHLRARYLVAEGADYRLAESLSAHCVFLTHDAIQQPPFFELDLISCRNLLAFLELPAQRRALEHFRDALRPGGLLLVGQGESIAAHQDLFTRASTTPGLYQRVEQRRSAQPAAPAPERAGDAHRAAFESTSTPAAVLDVEGRVVELNTAFAELLGRNVAQVVGRPTASLLQEADAARLGQAWPALQRQGRLELDVQLQGSRPQAGAVRLCLTRWAGERAAYVLAELLLPGTGRAQRLPGATPALLGAGLRLMSESMIATDLQGVIIEMNPSAERLTGWSRAEALGQVHDRVLRLVGSSGTLEASPIWACLRDQVAVARGQAADRYLLSRDGRRLTVRLSCAPLLDEDGMLGAMLLLQDTTEQSLLAEELAYRSSHDPVTGLLNRDEFERRLSATLADAHANGTEHLLCYIDLDQFKVINDTLGHYAGDELLRQIAAIFRARLRPQDALARLGGDEFGVLLAHAGVEAGRSMVESLLEAARGFRFFWEAQNYSTTVSIGVSLVSAACANTARALSDADAACYAAKDAGRDRARWASEGDADIKRRHGEMSLVGKIGKALDENQFVLFYEDVVPTNAPTQVLYRELLVRMRDDDGRLVRPGGFIAAAERYYLMTALDRWVVNAAFEGIAQLPSDGVLYAVNVSGMSLSDDKFLQYVIACIDRTGVAPERICFEITETAAISHLSEAVHFIERLAELGCRFALDDFGAGMASFSYLKNLPVQFIKIDGSFVRSMQASRVDRGMVEAINRIGHEMGLRTIAEHVEDVSLLQTLAAIGVDWVQGQAIAPGQPFASLLPGARS